MDAHTIGEKWQAYATTLEAQIAALRAEVKALDLKGGEWAALRARLEKDLDVCRELLAEKDHDIQRAANIITDLKVSLREANERIVELQQGSPPVIVDPGPIVVDPGPVTPHPQPTRLDFSTLASLSVEDLKDMARAKLPQEAKDAPKETRVGSYIINDLSADLRFVSIAFKGNQKSAVGIGRGGQYADITQIPARDLTFRRCKHVPNFDGNQGFWVTRAYNIDNVIIDECEIVGEVRYDAGGRGQFSLLEHGFYVGRKGDVHVRRSLFENLGGHPLQNASRAWPYQRYLPDNQRIERSTLHHWDNCGVIGTEGFPGRGSSAFSHFDPGSMAHPANILIDGCVAVQVWDRWRDGGNNIWEMQRNPAIWDHRNGEGVFVVASYDIWNEHAETGQIGHIVDTFRIENSVLVRGHNPNKPFGSMVATRSFQMHGCFGGGPASSPHFIDIDKTDVNGDGRPGLPDGANIEHIHITDSHLPGVGAHIWQPGGGRITIPFHCPGGEVVWSKGMTAPIIN